MTDERVEGVRQSSQTSEVSVSSRGAFSRVIWWVIIAFGLVVTAFLILERYYLFGAIIGGFAASYVSFIRFPSPIGADRCGCHH